MDIAEGNIGSLGKFDLKISGGVASIEVEGQQGAASESVKISVDAGVLLDKLAAAIPGQLDDAVIAVAKEAIKKL